MFSETRLIVFVAKNSFIFILGGGGGHLSKGFFLVFEKAAVVLGSDNNMLIFELFKIPY